MPSASPPGMSTSQKQRPDESVGGAGIRDMATDRDDLGFGPYVKSLAAFLTHADTRPPLTVSIEGPWGCGKSSFMLQVSNEVYARQKEVYVRESKKPRNPVWFNAWRFDKEEALWAAFALSVTQSLARDLPWYARLYAHLKLQVKRFDWKKGWFGLTRFLLVAAFLVYTLIAAVRYLAAHGDALNPFSSKLKASAGSKEAGVEKPEDALLRLLFATLGGGGYIFLTAWLFKKAVDVVGNPFQIDLRRYSGQVNYEERISFIERFHKDFGEIVHTYAGDMTVFIFIDDLDRCEIPRAAELMQAINLLLSDSSQIIYVLGLDREKIAAGLASKFHDVLPFLNEKRGGSTEFSGLDFGYSYLEKFIQISFQVPRPADPDIARLLSKLNDEKPTGADEQPSEVSPGLLFETKADSPLVKDITMKVAPALEHNPRRIKQFINHFRLSAIIATQTGLFGLPRDTNFAVFTPEILGKLLAITLRWPLLIADAAANPGLLEALERDAIQAPDVQGGELPDAVRELVHYWGTKPLLRGLLRVGLAFSGGKPGVLTAFSLVRLDLERYLQVAPAIRQRAEREENHVGTQQSSAATTAQVPSGEYPSQDATSQRIKVPRRPAVKRK
jgi:hypothetical protein